MAPSSMSWAAWTQGNIQRREWSTSRGMPALVDGLDDAVGVGERRGDGLFAEDALDAGVHGVHGDLRVDVVAGDDADDVQILFLEHLAVAGVGVDLG